LKIRFHYKGYFICDPDFAYKCGKVHEFGGEWNTDEVNLIDLDKLVREIGVEGEYKLWYVTPGGSLNGGLRLLKTDRDCVRFINEFENEVAADFYVETPVTEGLDSRYDSDVEVVEEVKGSEECSSDGEYIVEGEGGEEEGEGSEEEGEGPEGSEGGEEKQSGGGSVEGLSDYDSEYDEDWEWTSVLPDHTLNPTAPSSSGLPIVVDAAQSSRNPAPTTLSDFEDDNADSEELESPYSSSDDGVGKKKLNKFVLNENEQVSFQVGQVFANAELIKAAVKEYALQSRKNVYVKKNERKRVIVKCMPKCPFHMRFSRAEPKTYYVLSRYRSGHKCYFTKKARLLKTTILAKKLVPILKHTPNMKLKALGEECKTRWGAHLSKFQLYRAKNKALEMIHGGIDEQYTHLRNYAEELLRSNPGSTVKIKCNAGLEGPLFERMYVCFNASKRGFVQSCRPLIGLDGCFLKGRYAGHLLSAIGKDGNNQMMPIAFAVVEAETKESWDWFLDLLLADLNGIQHKRWAFISDQQKVAICTFKFINYCCVSIYVKLLIFQ